MFIHSNNRRRHPSTHRPSAIDYHNDSMHPFDYSEPPNELLSEPPES